MVNYSKQEPIKYIQANNNVCYREQSRKLLKITFKILALLYSMFLVYFVIPAVMVLC